VPAAFAVLSLGALIYASAHSQFWQRAHDMAPAAAFLILILLGLLLLRRSRFAWWVFTVMLGAALVTWCVAVPRNGATSGSIVGGFIGLAQFGLLISPPMRRFVGFRGRLSPSTN
jgi:hypothetical protein